jgi:hypothetical protein
VEEDQRARIRAADLGVNLLQDAGVIVDGVRFLGSTLWTDYALFGNPVSGMLHARRWLNDHRVIYPTEIADPLAPEKALRWHMQSRFWLTEALRSPFDGPTVVVTHHLPHPLSVHARFATDPLTPAFCSDLSDLVENSGTALWVHGHTHTSCDYVAGNTRVVCNPKGYGPLWHETAVENPDFDPALVLEI